MNTARSKPHYCQNRIGLRDCSLVEETHGHRRVVALEAQESIEMTYRPITDMWILARPKVKYYGAYPSGFLERARALLGVTMDDTVLHVCAGRVRDYPFRGFGRKDRTLDLDSEVKPDYLRDCRYSLATYSGGWPAILADPPYSEQDAMHYVSGPVTLPTWTSSSTW